MENIDEMFSNAQNITDIEKIYTYIPELKLDPAKLAVYLKMAKGSRTLKEFARNCKDLVEKTMGKEIADRCGASAPTFTRIARGDSPDVEDDDKIKRPLDLHLLWAIWECRDNNPENEFSRDKLFRANRYGLESEKNRVAIEAADMNGGSSRDKRYRLIANAKNTITERLLRSNLYYQPIDGLSTAFELAEASEKDVARVKEALFANRSEEEVMKRIAELNPRREGISPFRIIYEGITGVPFGNSGKDNLMLKIQNDETMYWYIIVVDEWSRSASYFMRDYMVTLLYRDQWEPETLPDSIIKITYLCLDKKQYEFVKEATKGLKLNSLVSIMHADYDNHTIEETVLERKKGKTPDSLFPKAQ